jgi:hypothetical protein
VKGFLIAAMTVSLFGGAYASAQVGLGAVPAPLGITSPLGMGPAAAVGTTGIPLGATELATPGVSPGAISPLAQGASMSTTACSGTGNAIGGESSATGVISGTSAPTPLFDGAGVAGTASGTCAGGAAASASPAASASSPGIGARSSVGRIGIPLGSTELSTGGLSPLPDITEQSQPSIVTSGTGIPCPTTGIPTITSTPAGGC